MYVTNDKKKETMLFIGVITPKFQLSGFRPVREKQKHGVFWHSGCSFLPPFQQI